MATVIATNGSPASIPSAVVSGVSGTIDTGTDGPNILVPFTIPDEKLIFFGYGSIVATVGAGLSNDKCSITSDGDPSEGLFVDMNTGEVTQDDFNIAGDSTDAVEASPTVTINYTTLATFKPWFLDDFN